MITDSLAGLLPGDIEWGAASLDCEGIGYAAMDAYQEVRGKNSTTPTFPATQVSLWA